MHIHIQIQKLWIQSYIVDLSKEKELREIWCNEFRDRFISFILLEIKFKIQKLKIFLSLAIHK